MLAVEACLIAKLPTLLSPEDVLDMDDDAVTALAAEDEESSAERSRCNEKLQVLENGLSELKSVREYPTIDFEGKHISHICEHTRINIKIPLDLEIQSSASERSAEEPLDAANSESPNADGTNSDAVSMNGNQFEEVEVMPERADFSDAEEAPIEEEIAPVQIDWGFKPAPVPVDDGWGIAVPSLKKKKKAKKGGLS